MPKVYDFNGSAATQIKNIYDWNGSVATQNKKGYDSNGTTSSLIYSADMPLFTNGTRNVAWTGVQRGSSAGTYSNSSTQLIAETTAGTTNTEVDRHVGWYTTSKISVNGYNTLRFVFPEIYLKWGPCDYVVCGLTSSPSVKQPYDPESAADMLSSGAGWVACSLDWTAGTRTNVTRDINISSITGSYYVCVLAVVRYENSRQARFKMSQATLL